MSSPGKKGVRNPLQLLGMYLFWMEAAAAAGMFATRELEHWTRHFLVFVAALGIFVYVSTAAFVVIYLTVRRPHFLFNPSDYDKTVQPQLLGPSGPRLAIDNPPSVDEVAIPSGPVQGGAPSPKG